MHHANVKDSLFVKNNGNIVKKQKHLLKISVRELHNDMILPIYERVCFGTRIVDGKLCIGDMSLRKYIDCF